MSKHIHLPVGWKCLTAFQVKTAGKRKCAYPFDWTIKNYDSIYYSLKYEFSNLLTNYKIGEEEYEAWYDDRGKTSVKLHAIYDYNYQTVFVHDYTEDATIESIKEKYKNRLIRLQEHIGGAEELTLYGGEFNNNSLNKQTKIEKERLDIDLKELWTKTKNLEDIKEIFKSWNPKLKVHLKQNKY